MGVYYLFVSQWSESEYFIINGEVWRTGVYIFSFPDCPNMLVYLRCKENYMSHCFHSQSCPREAESLYPLYMLLRGLGIFRSKSFRHSIPNLFDPVLACVYTFFLGYPQFGVARRIGMFYPGYLQMVVYIRVLFRAFSPKVCYLRVLGSACVGWLVYGLWKVSLFFLNLGCIWPGLVVCSCRWFTLNQKPYDYV